MPKHARINLFLSSPERAASVSYLEQLQHNLLARRSLQQLTDG